MHPAIVAAVLSEAEVAAAAPAPEATLDAFNPTSGGIGQLIIIGLSNMPTSFTLNDITLGGAPLNSPTKNSDDEVQGFVAPGHSTGQLVVEYDSTESVDSSLLTPSVFTVT